MILGLMRVQTGQDNRYTAPISDSASRITSLQEHKDIEARMQKKVGDKGRCSVETASVVSRGAVC